MSKFGTVHRFDSIQIDQPRHSTLVTFVPKPSTDFFPEPARQKSSSCPGLRPAMGDAGKLIAILAI